MSFAESNLNIITLNRVQLKAFKSRHSDCSTRSDNVDRMGVSLSSHKRIRKNSHGVHGISLRKSTNSSGALVQNGNGTQRKRILTNGCGESQHNHLKTDGNENNIPDTVEEIGEDQYSSPVDSEYHDPGGHVLMVLSGNVENNLKRESHVVRVFASSTFTDTVDERNILMEKVYPKIRRHCQRRGYEFHVVDMRWGIRDCAADEHLALDLCLEEIDTCQQLSTGPTFVSLLGQKYGYRPLPSKICQTEFEQLVAKTENPADLRLLDDWYVCDDNHIPAAYVLQPVSSVISAEENKDGSKTKTWSHISNRLLHILRGCAQSAKLDEDLKKKYLWSITDAEIERGLADKDSAKNVLWFSRNIKDLNANLKHEEAWKYSDQGDDEKLETEKLLEKLKSKMVKQLPKENIFKYSVTWEGGILTSEGEREEFLDTLCHDFYKELVSRIDKAVQEKVDKDISFPLYEEVVQHLTFAQSKCQSFFGREEQLDAIRVYLQGNSSAPLVVHGESGSGKTSLMSKAFANCQKWLNHKADIIIRYLGTTPGSSMVRKLINSLCEQLTILDKQRWHPIQTENFKELQAKFLELLQEWANLGKNKLVIFLDSLDQLSPEDNALELHWVPLTLPENVKMVLSTLPDQQYVCLPVLRSHLSEECFVLVPRLPSSDARCILQDWLTQSHRALTQNQTKIVLQAFEKCSLPIFLRISIDEALRWKSYSPPDETILQTTVRGAIDSLFQRVEHRHGHLLVKRALAYITAAKTGLTETELGDVLSCDDQVLDDVFQYWIPPVRRIPPLLWLRIKRDLSLYLVGRGADDSTVVIWYHRQFLEAATERYLKDKEELLLVHSNLADYFLGKWSSGVKKPFLSSEGVELAMDRLVSPQPIFFTTSDGNINYNTRKLSELPFHLIKSNRLDELKRHCLCNYEFLLALLKARSLQDVLDNFDMALSVFEEDSDLSLVRKTLRLSTNALSLWPGQLASQLLCRLPRTLIDKSPSLQYLEDQARAPSIPALIPNEVCLVAPGGALVDSLSGPVDLPSLLQTSVDGSLIVCASFDSGLFIWEASTGKLIKNIEFHAKGQIRVALSKQKDVVIVTSSGLLRAWQLPSGQPLFSRIKGRNTWATIVETAGGECILFTDNDSFELLELKTGDVKKSFAIHKTNRSPFISLAANFLMVAYKSLVPSGSSFEIDVFDINEEKYVRSYSVPSHGNVEKIEMLSSTKLLFAKVRKNSIERARTSVASASNCMDISLSLCCLDANYKSVSLTQTGASVRYYALTRDKSRITMLCNSEFVEQKCEFQAVVKIIHFESGSEKCYKLHYPSTIILLDLCKETLLVTASLDKILRVWNLESLDEAGDANQLMIPEEDFHVISVRDSVAFLRSDALRDSTTSYMVWNIRNNCKFYYRGLLAPSAALLSGMHVVILHQKDVQLYSTKDGKLIRSLQITDNEDREMSLHRLSGQHFALISYTSSLVQIYEVPSLSKTKEICFKEKGEIFSFTTVSGNCERFAVGLKSSASNSDEKTTFVAIITNETDEKPAYVYYGYFESNFDDLAISESGTVLLDVLYDSRKNQYRVSLWNVQSRNQIFLMPPKDACHVAVLSNSGTKFLAAHWDGTISCWTISENSVLVTPLWKCKAHSGPVHKIFLAADGDSALTIAGGFNSKDRSIRLWNAKKGTLDVEFTPDVKISSLGISSKLDLIVVEIQDKVILFQVVLGRLATVYSETPTSG